MFGMRAGPLGELSPFQLLNLEGRCERIDPGSDPGMQLDFQVLRELFFPTCK